MESNLAEKYLAVRVDIELSTNQQGPFLAKKANSVLDFIRNNIAGRSKEMIHFLYSALVRQI